MYVMQADKTQQGPVPPRRSSIINSIVVPGGSSRLGLPTHTLLTHTNTYIHTCSGPPTSAAAVAAAAVASRRLSVLGAAANAANAANNSANAGGGTHPYIHTYIFRIFL